MSEKTTDVMGTYPETGAADQPTKIEQLLQELVQGVRWLANGLDYRNRTAVPVRIVAGAALRATAEESVVAPTTAFPCVNFVTGSYPGLKVPLYNACDECRQAVIVWNTGKTSSYAVAPKSTRWITVDGISSQQVDDIPCGDRAGAAQEGAVRESTNADPPANVRELVISLLRGFPEDDCIKRKQIPELVLQHLDAFASSVSGEEGCEVKAIYGCGSCCNNNMRANYVDTTCGWQCWTCAADPCG